MDRTVISTWIFVFLISTSYGLRCCTKEPCRPNHWDEVIHCGSKCFLKTSVKDGTSTRGCFDTWMGSPVSHRYEGCRLQEYMGEKVEWCFCKKDSESPCNGKTRGEIHTDSYESYPINSNEINQVQKWEPENIWEHSKPLETEPKWKRHKERNPWRYSYDKPILRQPRGYESRKMSVQSRDAKNGPLMRLNNPKGLKREQFPIRRVSSVEISPPHYHSHSREHYHHPSRKVVLPPQRGPLSHPNHANRAKSSYPIARSAESKESDFLKCFVCHDSSPYCGHTVTNSKRIVISPCQSRCFIKQDDSGKIHRGCFDGFRTSSFVSDYDGCREQVDQHSQHKSLWCFCDKSQCNGASIRSFNAQGYHDKRAPSHSHPPVIPYKSPLLKQSSSSSVHHHPPHVDHIHHPPVPPFIPHPPNLPHHPPHSAHPPVHHDHHHHHHPPPRPSYSHEPRSHELPSRDSQSVERKSRESHVSQHGVAIHRPRFQNHNNQRYRRPQTGSTEAYHQHNHGIIDRDSRERFKSSEKSRESKEEVNKLLSMFTKLCEQKGKVRRQGHSHWTCDIPMPK